MSQIFTNSLLFYGLTVIGIPLIGIRHETRIRIVSERVLKRLLLMSWSLVSSARR